MPWESGAKAKRRNEPAEVALSYWICPLTVKRQGNAAIQLTVKYSLFARRAPSTPSLPRIELYIKLAIRYIA